MKPRDKNRKPPLRKPRWVILPNWQNISSGLVAEARLSGALLEVFVEENPDDASTKLFRWKVTPSRGTKNYWRLGFAGRWKEKTGSRRILIAAIHDATSAFQKIVRNSRENK